MTAEGGHRHPPTAAAAVLDTHTYCDDVRTERKVPDTCAFLTLKHAASRYNAMLDSMEAAGIEPNATLHHFTHPQVRSQHTSERTSLTGPGMAAELRQRLSQRRQEQQQQHW